METGRSYETGARQRNPLRTAGEQGKIFFAIVLIPLLIAIL